MWRNWNGTAGWLMAVTAVGLLTVNPARAAGPLVFTHVEEVQWEVSQPPLRTGVGMAVLDWDGDGLSDLLIGGGVTKGFQLFRNLGDMVFQPLDSKFTGLGSYGSDMRGIGAADYDNDGDVDLFVSCWTSGEFSAFLRNDDGMFVDVTHDVGLNVLGDATTGAWGDYDNDGHLDLFVSRYYSQRNILYHNKGDGTFHDATYESGIEGDPTATATSQSFQGVWMDMDWDGDLDLYLLNDRCYSGWAKNALYLHQPDHTFVQNAAYLGLDLCFDAMAAAVNDVDGDGFLDLLMSNIYYGHFLMKRSCSGFEDVSLATGITALQWGWGVALEDFDNDGHPDAYICHEDLGTGNNTNRIFHNQGDGTFADVSDAAYTGTEGNSILLVTADFDLDGDMDLVVGDTGEGSSIRILRNDTEGDSWLQIGLTGVTSNIEGIGATVEVLADGRWRRRIRYESSSFGARSEPILHFGLGNATVVHRIIVRWPSGIVQRVEDVTPNQRITLIEPATSVDTVPPLHSEQCGDAIDNDCDGLTDEGYAVGTPCAVEIDGCAYAGTIGCSIDRFDTTCQDLTPASPEICGDGIDNDCDGVGDAVFGLGTACTLGLGACAAAGVLACSEDGLSAVCDALPGIPGEELCLDGIDNDCDGEADEMDPDLTGIACLGGLGACQAPGILNCVAGTADWLCDAEVGLPEPERCEDGVDNDCNGETDEGFNLGAPCPVSTGACATSGVLACDDAGAAACHGEPLPADEERCDDGVDNDCDGETDEGFPIGASCTSGLGICAKAGVYACEQGATELLCDAIPSLPEPERCGDGLDNDCDGETDEGFAVGSPCVLGEGACAENGNLICAADGYATSCWVPGYQAPMERCGDGLDNDCDGDTDEGFEVGAACAVGLGSCQEVGVMMCDADGLSMHCDALPGAPSPEVKGDAIDNDCDGQIDEEGESLSEGCEGAQGPFSGILSLLLFALATRRHAWTPPGRGI